MQCAALHWNHRWRRWIKIFYVYAMEIEYYQRMTRSPSIQSIQVSRAIPYVHRIYVYRCILFICVLNPINAAFIFIVWIWATMTFILGKRFTDLWVFIRGLICARWSIESLGMDSVCIIKMPTITDTQNEIEWQSRSSALHILYTTHIEIGAIFVIHY